MPVIIYQNASSIYTKPKLSDIDSNFTKKNLRVMSLGMLSTVSSHYGCCIPLICIKHHKNDISL